MPKPRPKSRFASLAPAQLETLTRWLIVENIVYTEAVERLREQFNFKTSEASLCEFYKNHLAKVSPRPDATGPALLTIEISFHGPDKIQLRVLPGAKTKGNRPC